jgi:hypothetical protein
LTSLAEAATPDANLRVVTKTSAVAERAAARAYWTPELMRAAALNDVSNSYPTNFGLSGEAELKAEPSSAAKGRADGRGAPDAQATLDAPARRGSPRSISITAAG